MKRIAVVTALVAVLALSTVTFASYTQVAVYMLGGTSTSPTWTTPPVGSLGLYAKAFTSNPAQGSCNRAIWKENITNHVAVSQWIDYTFAGTRWDWLVRKPGTFAADCITFNIRSNDDVTVTFDGFSDLAPLLPTDNSATPIRVWYSWGLQGIDAPPIDSWLTPTELNEAGFQLDYETVSGGFTRRLWNKISIPENQRACEYQDSGTITLTLTDVKCFIDPETGLFNGALPRANP